MSNSSKIDIYKGWIKDLQKKREEDMNSIKVFRIEIKKLENELLSVGE